MAGCEAGPRCVAEMQRGFSCPDSPSLPPQSCWKQKRWAKAPQTPTAERVQFVEVVFVCPKRPVPLLPEVHLEQSKVSVASVPSGLVFVQTVKFPTTVVPISV